MPLPWLERFSRSLARSVIGARKRSVDWRLAFNLLTRTYRGRNLSRFLTLNVVTTSETRLNVLSIGRNYFYLQKKKCPLTIFNFNSIKTPDSVLLQGDLFDRIFFIIIPSIIGGFGNFLIPILGSPDIAFPRINNIRFWLLPPSLLLLLLNNIFYPNSGTGWTVYPPLSLYIYHPSPSVNFAIFSIHIIGISSILESLNFIVTIFIIENCSLNYAQINLFSWSISITVILLILSLPVLAGASTILLFEIEILTHHFLIQ